MAAIAIGANVVCTDTRILYDELFTNLTSAEYLLRFGCQGDRLQNIREALESLQRSGVKVSLP